MAALKLGMALLALAIAGPARADPVADPIARWRPHIREASVRFGVPSAWIERVIAAESGGRTILAGAPIRSRAGAMGLMQLMPGTWAALRRELGLGPDPDEPRANILAGSFYLRKMYDRFGYPGLFAAYHAGPTRYAEHLGAGRALPAETIAYLRSVGGDGVPAAGDGSRETTGSVPPQALFAVRRPGVREPGSADPYASPGPLFVVRADAR